jgi:glutamate--cysteine ligase
VTTTAPRAGPALLRADLEQRLFTPVRPNGPHGIGLEIECLALDASTGAAARIDPSAPRSSLGLLRRHGTPLGWNEETSYAGAPMFRLPNGGTLGFEPGGQLEYSSPVCRSGSALVRQVRAVLEPLAARAREEGIALLFVGIDPYNTLDRAPLQLHSERYVKMAEHFARRGPAGGWMMRQTASVQVNLDLGERPYERWTLLNAAAPYVGAIFANSPIHAGRATGFASTRAHAWRRLDPSRTGLPCDRHAPVDGYLAFALHATHFLGPAAAPFAQAMEEGEVTLADWRTHLTTLFPEVRPRGWFEVRSADAVGLEWLAAPVALLAGIAYDRDTEAAARELLGDPDPALLDVAARDGLRAPALGRTARDLFALALGGCARLGARFLAAEHLAEAEAFYRRFTARGRTPGDERIERIERR